MSEPLAARQRLLSLDALRGLDMLCIIGLEDLIRAIAHLWPSGLTETLAEQFEHVPWEGLHAYDLIFPTFMFLSGVSLALSLDARVERGDSKGKLWGKILTRALLLVLFGMIYNGVFSNKPAEPRFASVLGQIGLAWAAAASLCLVVKSWKARLGICIGWLVAVACLQLLVPVPGHGAGMLTPEGAINAWFDRQFLPGRLHGGTFDPEGLFSVICAVPITLAGALAGGGLKSLRDLPWKFTGLLAGSGAFAVILAAIFWKLGYPPVKALWTTTFDLFAIGIASMLFALFFAIIDVARIRKWCFPLCVIGVNSITIYLGSRLVSFPEMSEFLFGRLSWLAGNAAEIVIICGVILLQWLVLWFLYRRQWFLRV